ncbi:AraC family transcriptional regulator [Rhodobacteraceae bacterium W635]|uniref:GyrI-like domain-containing protein n=1 Tax=Nioella halotolerans TaxID=2303578 RepID=UPI000E3BA1E0|nr:AraC family transcriptional regulator [Rhodobacteraceae bacterium W635]
MGAVTMEHRAPEIRSMPETHTLGFLRSYSMATLDELPDLWRSFFDAPVVIPNYVPGAMFGVSMDADGVGSFTYGVTVEVDPVPEELPRGTSLAKLPQGDYAVLRDFGTLDDVQVQYDWMIAEWLPASPYRQRRGAIFERYPEDPRNGPNGMVFEIWVPVNDRPN